MMDPKQRDLRSLKGRDPNLGMRGRDLNLVLSSMREIQCLVGNVAKVVTSRKIIVLMLFSQYW